MHPIARLWQYARAYRTRIRLAVVYTILNKLFDVLPEAIDGKLSVLGPRDPANLHEHQLRASAGRSRSPSAAPGSSLVMKRSPIRKAS